MLNRFLPSSQKPFWTAAICLFVSSTARAVDQTDTVVGTLAGASLTTGTSDTAVGYTALRFVTTGSQNTAVGRGALYGLQTTSGNTAVGYSALYSNAGGELNTAVGTEALSNTTSGHSNAAMGARAAIANTTGVANTATGFAALSMNTSGSYNTSIGYFASREGTTSYATAVGAYALQRNTAEKNTAVGAFAMIENVTGAGNTVVGYAALAMGSQGFENTAVGTSAAENGGYYSTAVGYQALMTSNTSFNTAVGRRALANNASHYNTAVGADTAPIAALSNTGAFGYGATPTVSNQIVIGNSSVSQIGGAVPWTVISDARFKKDVNENVPGLAFIRKLRPVTYHWDMKKLNETDGAKEASTDPVMQAAAAEKGRKLYTGFLAQEVDAAARECDFDFSGVVKPANDDSRYQLGYAEFVVPLVKAVQEQQKELEVLRAQVTALQKGDGLVSANMWESSGWLALAGLGAIVAFRRSKS